MTYEDGKLKKRREVSADEIDRLLTQRPRSRWLQWKIIAPAAIALGAVVLGVSGGANDGAERFISEPVREGSLDLFVSATGGLRPTNQVEVGSEVSGRIDKIFVDVNDHVTQGQVLAVINTDLIDDQIRQFGANLQASQASVAQAQATLQVGVTQLNRLEDVYQRSGGKVPSQVELDQARATVQRDRAALASARANVAAQAAQLSSARTNQARAVIRAPVSGVVIARQIEPGQTVVANFTTPTLFVLAEDLAQMQLRVDVDEADVGQVQEGQKARFTVDAFPGRDFPATVERIDIAASNIATEQAGNAAAASGSVVTYEARLAVTNTQSLLRPGMTATTRIATARTGKGLLVPNSALRFDPEAGKVDTGEAVLSADIGINKREQRAAIGVGSKQTVHVIGEDGELDVIEVITGRNDGRTTKVRSEQLKPGMRVVIASIDGAQ
ncbi:MAG: efflux RND transporter periplasmic adaptor subunit [Pseudomonadota bacterium]